MQTMWEMDRTLREKNISTNAGVYVPGLKPPPKYIKLSSLSFKQQFSMLRVIADKHPHILEDYKFQIAVNRDQKIFTTLRRSYEEEQKDFLEWAKTLWISDDKDKALTPTAVVEEVYKSLIDLHFNNLSRLQPNYEIVAHIELKHKGGHACTFTLEEDLLTVNNSELPELVCPPLTRKYSLFNKKSMLPNVCDKHPNILMPNESLTDEPPINEVYEELARFAARQNVTFIMSEGAVTRLMEEDREYTLPLFARSLVCADGETRIIVVLGSEIIHAKQPARYRNHNAIQVLINSQFIKKSHGNDTDENSSKPKKLKKTLVSPTSEEHNAIADMFKNLELYDTSADDEMIQPAKRPRLEEIERQPSADQEMLICTCRGSTTKKLCHRTFRKWTLTYEGYSVDIIIHCAHKCQMNGKEYIIEPIPEYQLQLGGTVQNVHKLRSLALSLFLRKNAKLLNVRVDTETGEIVTYDYLTLFDLSPNGELINGATHILFAVLNYLTEINSGDYMLVHKPNKGNVALYSACPKPVRNGFSLTLNYNITMAEEHNDIDSPPNLGPIFLPFHKYRKILPLAFTYDSQLLICARTPMTSYLLNRYVIPSLYMAGPSNVWSKGKGPKGSRRPSRGFSTMKGPSTSGMQRPSSASDSSSTSSSPSTSGQEQPSSTSGGPSTSGLQRSSSMSYGPSTSGQQRSSTMSYGPSTSGLQRSSSMSYGPSTSGLQPSSSMSYGPSTSGLQPSSSMSYGPSTSGLQPSSSMSYGPSTSGLQPSSSMSYGPSTSGLQQSSSTSGGPSTSGLQRSTSTSDGPSTSGLQRSWSTSGYSPGGSSGLINPNTCDDNNFAVASTSGIASTPRATCTTRVIGVRRFSASSVTDPTGFFDVANTFGSKSSSGSTSALGSSSIRAPWAPSESGASTSGVTNPFSAPMETNSPAGSGTAPRLASSVVQPPLGNRGSGSRRHKFKHLGKGKKR